MSPSGEWIAGGRAVGEHLQAAKRLQGRVQPLVPAGPEDHALSGSSHGAAHQARRAATCLQQLGGAG